MESSDRPPDPGSDIFTEQRRSSFGSVAEQYDRSRPEYPPALIDDVLEYTGAVEGLRALEVGAGTGQATSQFAQRGVSILAIEPSADMAMLAAARFAKTEYDVVVRASDFETASVEPHSFDLVYVATAWHWITPALRWRLVSQALMPSGSLAVFWNWPRWRQTPLIGRFDALYEASGVDLSQIGMAQKAEPDLEALERWWMTDLEDTDAFNEATGHTYTWSLRYTAQQYVELIATYADHIVLAPEVREPLLGGVHAIIMEAGGTIDVQYSTLLLLARASG